MAVNVLSHSISTTHSHNAKLCEGDIVLESFIAPYSKSKEQKKHIKNKEINKFLILKFSFVLALTNGSRNKTTSALMLKIIFFTNNLS